MTTFNALQSALSGIRAQSRAMEDISSNIANSRTTAFKRINTSFAELVSGLEGKGVPGGTGVTTNSRSVTTLAGEITRSDNPLNMAVNGEGYFTVQTPKGETAYTRRGDFNEGLNGFLTNSAGMLLMDEAGKPVQVNREPILGRPTTEIDYRLNVPAVPRTTAWSADEEGSNLLSGAFAASIPASQSADFLNQSLPGGSIRLYSPAGGTADVDLRWGKTSSESGAENWALYYRSNAAASGDQISWSKIGDYQFSGSSLSSIKDASGAPSGNTGVTVKDLTVSGVSFGDVRLAHGAAGLTQHADHLGAVTPTTLRQNGLPKGEFSSVSINDEGGVIAKYSNGETKKLSQIKLVTFADPEGLKRGEGGEFQATELSGDPVEMGSWGLRVGALEGSNIDMPQEFTMLILTQQAYSANTRMISASDEMLKNALDELR